MKSRLRPRYSGRPRKFLLPATVVLIAALAVWTMGLFRFAAAIPDQVEQPDLVTDAIVVLTGGSGRLDTGLRLLSEYRAKILFVSGVYRGVDVAKLLALSRRAPEELSCCVEIGHVADNTAGNAVESAAWAKKKGVRSLRIVTSSYHMPRSLLEFRQAMPDVTLVPHPVFPEHVKKDRWWARPGTAGLIVGEYNKFLLARMVHLIDRVTDLGTEADRGETNQ